MSLIGNLFCSTVGRKFLMAVSGLILVGFVIGHLVGNLQIFGHPDSINGYAQFLHSLGPLLWVTRIGLLIAAVIHIWAAIALTRTNAQARGAQHYGVNRWIRAPFASRYMRLTGFVVLAFLAYHLAQFTLGYASSSTFKGHLPEYTMASDFHIFGFPAVEKGHAVDDVYSMVFYGFQNPVISFFYILAVGLLTIHLLHGFQSVFHSFGWYSASWAPALRAVTIIFCIGFFFGNASMPAAILSGWLKPAQGTNVAAQPRTALNQAP
ncbi:MAG: succinate dehydrogenase cytochrome b subunit [Opitutaceae bacterium]|nr:succinate dehydrogenase cytochrome b subunit [Opitutaceae bacterium]